ncbi:MAG: aminotransferase class V-fold PLP-dependent enzyme [Anaerolineales bacterium]|nr:aminotransferase class V-fold PLP-dependent enzyme [Anaerolineales bacterium]
MFYLREGVALSPTTYGGPQEGTLRAGTENIPGIVGLGAALQLVNQHHVSEFARLSELREKLIEGVAARIPVAIVNSAPSVCAPHIVSISFDGADGEMMLFRLNEAGVAASMGSTCTSESIEPSHVLRALGLPLELIEGTLRFSMGYPTTEDEIEQLLELLFAVVAACKTGHEPGLGTADHKGNVNYSGNKNASLSSTRNQRRTPGGRRRDVLSGWDDPG